MNYLFVILSLRRSGAERVVVNICNELIKDKNNKVAIFLIENINEYDNELNKDIIIEGGDISFHLSLYKKNVIENSKYKAFVDSFKPYIIHSHLYLADILVHSYHYKPAVYISHLHNSKIEEYNGFEFDRILQKKMWTNLYEKKWLLNKYKEFKTSFIACSAGAKNLHRSKIKVGKSITLPNAIPLPQIHKNEKRFEQPIQLIWIGRLNNVKRPEIAISTAKMLKDLGFNFKLKVVGTGPNKNNCSKLIHDYSLTNEVELLGLVEDLDSIYRISDILIHTSVFEGLPMVFIEAMSYGIPIITTDCMPDNELIEDGVNGMILKSENPKDFVNNINKMINNSTLYQSISKNATETAKDYSIEAYVEKLVEFYKSILK